MDESTLIARARRGDLKAYDDLVRQYQDVAFRAAYLIMRDASDAQDVAQDAFIRAYDALERFDTNRSFQPWLLRIVSNIALNRLKASKRRQAMGERVQASVGTSRNVLDVESEVLRRERSHRLWEVISRLKPDDQTLLVLRYFMALGEAELAQTLGVARGTIKSRLHRAMQKLREHVRVHAPDLFEYEFQSADDQT